MTKEYKYTLQVKFPDFLGIKSKWESVVNFELKCNTERWINEYKAIYPNAEIRVI
jgi:hypothetical protein